MRLSSRLALSLAATVAFACNVSVMAATPAAVRAAEQTCKPGSSPVASRSTRPSGFMKYPGETPAAVPGAVTVSAKEAKCLMDKLGSQLLVFQTMNDDDRELPGAIAFAEIASSTEDEKYQAAVVDALDRVTKGDKDKPLLLYCHHTRCHLSYNGTLRATQAGYRKVFWLRGGNDEWVAAGYPLKSQTVDANGLPGDYANRVNACNDDVREFQEIKYVELVESYDPEDLEKGFLEKTKLFQRTRANCLSELSEKYASNKAAKADLAQRLGRSDAEVSQHFQAVRTDVESNPAKYIAASLAGFDISELEETLNRARSTKSIAETCGTFNPVQPTNPPEIDAFNAQLGSYRACVRGFKGALGLAGFNHSPTVDFESTVKALKRVSRFTCARGKSANCLPDAVFDRVARIATAENLTIVNRAQELRKNRADEIDAAEEHASEVLGRAKTGLRRIEANAQSSQSSQQPSHYAPAPAYQPPPAPVYRRPSNGMYQGVK